METLRNMETPQKSMPGLEEGALAWRPAVFGREYTPLEIGEARVAQVVAQARAGLEALQQADGHWVFELEADATMPAEFIFLEHFLGEIDQGARGQDRGLSPRDAGGSWRLVAVCRR